MNTEQIVRVLTAERDRLQRAIDALTDDGGLSVAEPARIAKTAPVVIENKPSRQVKAAPRSDGKNPCAKHPAAPRYKNGQCRECALDYQRRHDQEKKQQQMGETAVLRTPETRPKQSLPCGHGCGKEFTNEIWLRKHEEDCAHVIRPNGSASVARHTN